MSSLCNPNVLSGKVFVLLTLQLWFQSRGIAFHIPLSNVFVVSKYPCSLYVTIAFEAFCILIFSGNVSVWLLPKFFIGGGGRCAEIGEGATFRVVDDLLNFFS